MMGIHERFSFSFLAGLLNPALVHTLQVDLLHFFCYMRQQSICTIFIRSKSYLELEVLRVKIPFKNNTGFPFTVE